jgi:hypothetical protein
MGKRGFLFSPPNNYRRHENDEHFELELDLYFHSKKMRTELVQENHKQRTEQESIQVPLYIGREKF